MCNEGVYCRLITICILPKNRVCDMIVRMHVHGNMDGINVIYVFVDKL